MKAELNPQQLHLLFLDEPIDHTITHTRTFFAFARFWCSCLDVLDILSPLSALGQIMLYVDGMNGVIGHVETIQWLYTLVGSKVNTPVGARAEKKQKTKLHFDASAAMTALTCCIVLALLFYCFVKPNTSAAALTRWRRLLMPLWELLFFFFSFQSSTNTTGM